MAVLYAAQSSWPTPARKSAFRETGLLDEDSSSSISFDNILEAHDDADDAASDCHSVDTNTPGDLDHDIILEQQRLATRATTPRRTSALYRLGAAAMAFALGVPLLQGKPWAAQDSTPLFGATGGPIRRDAGPVLDIEDSLSKRQATSPTDVCFRWAHMSAVVNGTLYIYGGEAAPNREQTSNTWNNNFLSLDLTKSWQIASPSLAGLPQPTGPPAVALGTLWHSYDSLYLYGGEYSSNPVATPDPFSLWEYNIKQSKWIDHQDPVTSAGDYSAPAGESVGRAAEGSGISVPLLGRAWYFGGHQDGYTTIGWSQSIWRIYLTSILEYTFPGFTNTQVTSLADNTTAGADGVWRNITGGGVQTTNGFPERADGLLLYVPGYGVNGILVGLSGGTNDTFQQMNQLDVFDIATSIWYKQATSGSTPKIRVNACGVVASAPDGSSQNIYMFGGQNLQPAANQTQYDDMWILTLPSFTWIQVDQTSQSVPYARAGHTCNVWNAQMVVVGGYVDPEISCDSPGVYIYDMSNLKWMTSYSNLSSTSDAALVQNNPLNQQIAQRASVGQIPGLEGSYGYTVPSAVVAVIGGGPTGGATVTQPAQLPTDGPMKTGRPVTYTVTTTADGQTVTETAGGSSTSSTSKPNADHTGAIVAGVIAGVIAIIAIYLGYCTYLYRRRLAAYKRHLELSQRLSYNAEDTPLAAAAFYGHSGDDSDRTRYGKDSDEGSAFVAGHRREGSSHDSGSAPGSAYKGHGPGPGAGVRQTSVEDLLSGGEPSFWGTMLSPKRSLRVTNRD